MSKEFKVKLDKRAIAEITDKAGSVGVTRQYIDFVKEGAPLGDIRTVEVLLALNTYLAERHVEPDFEVVLSE